MIRNTVSAIALLAGVLALGCRTPESSQERAAPAQPGIEWTETQIKEAVAPVRAGRKLTPENWPDGARMAVCLGFDVDAETWNLRRGDTAPVPLSAGEYGAVSALPRILDLLDRHDLPASFYIPAASLILHPEMSQEILESGRHEIGVHGWIHENVRQIDDAAEEERLLSRSIEHLTKVTGRKPVGYRAPSWIFSKHTVDLLVKAGFLYDSSMMAMDEPYELVSNGQPTGLVELPIEWILDDAPYFGSTGSMPSPELVFQVYKDEFEMAYAEGTVFMLTMHPRVIGHRSRIGHLEKLVEHMKSKPDVWFATGEQIAEYVKKSSESH